MMNMSDQKDDATGAGAGVERQRDDSASQPSARALAALEIVLKDPAFLFHENPDKLEPLTGFQVSPDGSERTIVTDDDVDRFLIDPRIRLAIEALVNKRLGWNQFRRILFYRAQEYYPGEKLFGSAIISKECNMADSTFSRIIYEAAQRMRDGKVNITDSERSQYPYFAYVVMDPSETEEYIENARRMSGRYD